MRFVFPGLCLCVVLSAGCGGGTPTAPEDAGSVMESQQTQSLDQIRGFLESAAATGQIAYSELYGMDESLKAAGRPELLEDLNKVGSARGERAVKRAAEDMLAKL